MASIVKEKTRGVSKKKKTKAKYRSSYLEDKASPSNVLAQEDNTEPEVTENVNESEQEDILQQGLNQNDNHKAQAVPVLEQDISSNENVTAEACSKNLTTYDTSQKSVGIHSFINLNDQIEEIDISQQSMQFEEDTMWEFEHLEEYLQSKQNAKPKSHSSPDFTMLDSTVPTAPIFSERAVPQAISEEEIMHYETPKIECVALDEAIRLFGGSAIDSVKARSEREEAEVEAGPNAGPEHPLVDMLSTFRSSIRAMECERTRLLRNFDDEEKYRDKLWTVEKQKLHLTTPCKCGAAVVLKATYEQAQLRKEMLPVAKMKLEGILRDVQESYCHHQHSALLAHCQIEEVVSFTIQCDKIKVRDALSLVLQSLRMCDGASEALPAALQRWAEILASALVDELDLPNRLFIIHHLFRQTRSVRWGPRVLRTQVMDRRTAAITVAVLDILLSKMNLESAVECDEDMEGSWEEMDIRGGHGAVSSGTLRERDLIALVRALPLQQFISKLVMFQQADFREATEYDWGDATGGNELLEACYGVRTLISVLQRAVTVHASYERLQGVLRDLACAALIVLGCFYRSPRVQYLENLKEKITAELHTAFAATFTLFGTRELHKLPTTLLTDDAAKDYCLTFIMGLHDKTPKTIASLSIDAPVLTCDERVRIITQASDCRKQDHELARIVLDFLLQTGLKRKKVPCKTGCEHTARECVPILLTAHPYMYGLALHSLADLSQVETLDPSKVSVLHVNKWRPTVEEMQAVLDDWSQRCPALLQQLLLQLDYTPHTGVSLPVQLHIGKWLCTTSQLHIEHAWLVLVRLRTHRVCWGVPCEAPPPDPAPTDLLTMAHAVLTSEWGHSLPLICSHGVNAILTVCATRPREAVHCLAPVMLLMPQSPESVSLTPKFAELFTILLSCGPNLVQRALGRGGASGSELLLRLVLSQVDMKEPYVFTAWLHALWKVPAALSILDIAALAVRDWYTMDVYAASLIQESIAKEHITNAVRFAFTSPLLCECLLRAAHSHEVNSQLFPALLSALDMQRVASQKIHVDNALQKINPNLYSEDLIIYRCASAALVAPFQHPSHLTLWRLFFHIYLQRPHNQPSSVPCGPLFFSGIIKSRALSQIKKRLLETAAHHHIEADSYKPQPTTTNQPRNVLASTPIVESTLLPALTISDLTGEKDDCNDSDSEEESCQSVTLDGSTEEALEMERKRCVNMAAYHSGAEKMVREFIRWLDDGERVQASPQNAEIAWFIMPQALEEAWKTTLSRCRPPALPQLDSFPRPEPPVAYNTHVPLTPVQIAIATILNIKCRSNIKPFRRRKPQTINDTGVLLTRFEELLKEVQIYAEKWSTEVSRISSLDSKLWELVGTLRAPRPLPPVKKQCANKCTPVTFHLNAEEWCISAGAERGIKENRFASLTGIRRLTQARPCMARTAANLLFNAKRIVLDTHGVRVMERVWSCAGQLPPCTAAHSALTALFVQLAERWVIHKGQLCYELLSKYVVCRCSHLQQSLCGSLVSPRRLHDADWPHVYITVLNSNLPEHTIFSFLSRFELSRWKKTADKQQREAMIKALFIAAQRPIPENCEGVLLELIGVHTALLATASDLVWLLENAASVSASGDLPPEYWKHLNEAADEHAINMSMDDLSHIFRALGPIWRDASSDYCERHATYAEHTAELLSILMREFVTAGMKLTYTQSRICNYAFAELSVSWRPWVVPPSILPQPATGSQHYINMIREFYYCIKHIMEDLPDAAPVVLQCTLMWAVDTWLAIPKDTTTRPMYAALLDQLAQLPWNKHQWFTADVAHRMNRVWNQGEEIERWCYERFVATKTDTFLKGLQEANIDIETFLSYLLRVLCCNVFVTDLELINQACMLPWWKLRAYDLSQVLSQYLITFFNPSKPYTNMPHITLILHAVEMMPRSQYSTDAQTKRVMLINRMSQAYSMNELVAHSPDYVEFMLGHITRLDPYIKHGQLLPVLREKLEDTTKLLSCLATMTLVSQNEPPQILELKQAVWMKWCQNAPKEMLPRAADMAGQLTNLKCTGPVIECCVRTYVQKCDEWSALLKLWRLPLSEPHFYMENGLLHVAYGAAISSRHAPSAHTSPIITYLHNLTTIKAIDFVKDEVIIAAWICYMARCMHNIDAELSSLDNPTDDTLTRFEITVRQLRECTEAITSLLSIWGQEQSRSLIKMMTFQVETNKPTLHHRIMIRLVSCLRTPSPESALAYESACAALGTSLGEAATWGSTPTLRKLANLAARLLQVTNGFFRYEFQNAPVE